MADEQDAAATDQRASVARHAERADQLQRALVRIGSERAVIGESIREAAAALAEARGVEAAAGERRGSSDEAREQARHALLEAERRLGGGAGRMAELDAAQQQVVADVSRLEEALAGLERERELSLEGLPEMAAEAAPPTQPPSVDTEPDPATLGGDELADELRTTRRTIQQIGSVNPFAIEEHRELSNRLTELSRQEADLRAASEATQELIDRLDTEIAQQFQAAFAAIGQRFDEYCHLLFAGGSASLELTQDAESEAPGGIEIAVRPPGKRLQRLAMLSGGERALAGVALLFAMLTVNPVPFCVLDEVDAALDEANIGRFADALRRLAESIDFVVITHNRATIETADTIYGVTMTDAAVSRVLSLRLADLPVEVEVPA
jgi:chromosome segregation protein